MKPIVFHVEAGGEFRPVELAFARESEVRHLRMRRKMIPATDAGEFAALAAKRWFYYTREGATVTSFIIMQCGRWPKIILPIENIVLPLRDNNNILNRMKAAAQKKLKGEDWLRECFEYERTHPIAFASPRALLEARMIAEMDKVRRPRRRAPRNGVTHGHKAVAG